jgi:hypothetical protein
VKEKGRKRKDKRKITIKRVKCRQQGQKYINAEGMVGVPINLSQEERTFPF